MPNALLSDSIGESLDQVATALRQMRVNQRERAKMAAVQIENVVTKLNSDFPRDPAIALGVAFAIYKLAERFKEMDQADTAHGGGLIQLLS